jgi:hypothetical protein
MLTVDISGRVNDARDRRGCFDPGSLVVVTSALVFANVPCQ